MSAGSKPGERRGGRQLGTPNKLPDLRALTLQALMKAGGVDYLVRQAGDNPMGFLSLLGRVMPREAHVELTGELKIRQEVRRDLVEKVIVLMRSPEVQDTGNPAIEGTAMPLPALAHQPDTMLKAQRIAPRESLSRSTEHARKEGAAIAQGITQRAATMHAESAKKSAKRRSYLDEAAERIDGLTLSHAVQGDSLTDALQTLTGSEQDAAQEASLSSVGARTVGSIGPGVT